MEDEMVVAAPIPQTENGDLSEMFLTMDSEESDPYEKKYYSLLRRCESIQQNNERLVNRAHHVRKLLRRLRHERRMLMKRLDQHGDEYRNIPLTFPAEDDTQAFGLYSQPPYSPPSLVSAGAPISNNSLPVGSVDGASVPTPATLSTTKKKGRQEKDKDPNAPKKPANPFFLFCQEQRTTVMEQYAEENKEDIGHQELTKTLAKHWNNLTTDEKKVYYDLYDKEKERYEQEMKVYLKKGASPAEVPPKEASNGELS